VWGSEFTKPLEYRDGPEEFALNPFVVAFVPVFALADGSRGFPG